MQRADLKPCADCGKGVAHTGLPLFWRVRVERMGIDTRAVQRQHGMEQLLGSVALADIMGDGRPIASPLGEAVDLLLCEHCAQKANALPVAALLESEQDRRQHDANAPT